MEALERARATYGTGAYDDATIEFLFPEVKESEDERIRKEMIAFLKSEKAFKIIDLPISERWIAYLEKQKTSEEAIRYVKENHSSDEVSDFQAAMNIAVAKAYDKGVQDTLKKQKEQPEVDLEKELYEYICSDKYLNTRGNGSLLIARHFYELGKNARKEGTK